MSRPFNVAIEGSVGAGKTTVLRLLLEALKIAMPHITTSIILEPVEGWQDFLGENMLNNSYLWPATWGFQFQVLALQDMVRNYMKHTGSQLNIFERLPTTSTNVFAAKFLEDDIFNNTEMNILRKLEDCLLSSNSLNDVDLILYLRADPIVVRNRISARNRSEEASISIETLQQLNRLYDSHISNQEGATVVTIDANQDQETVLKECSKEIITRFNQVYGQWQPLSPALTPVKRN